MRKNYRKAVNFLFVRLYLSMSENTRGENSIETCSPLFDELALIM